MRLFPLFLALEGRLVLVVGGGVVAERKIAELLDVSAVVRVVALLASSKVVALADSGAIELCTRAFVEGDLDEVWLVIAATDDHDVNMRVAAAAESRRVFVNAVDDPSASSAYFASLLRRPPFTIAISSAGEAPALSRLLREILESVLPEERWIAEARALRARWRADGTPMASRFGELVRAIAAKLG